MRQQPNIPIVVVAYNRPDSLRRILESLQNASYPFSVKLIISIDKSDENEVVSVANNFNWKHGHKEVICHTERLGLKNHILSSGDMALSHDAVIVLEDDLYVSPGFYNYILQAFRFYNNESSIAGISLYAHSYNESAQLPFTPLIDDSDVFFMQTPSSWGQCWTKAQWLEFRKWYDQNNALKLKLESGIPANIAEWPDSSWKKYFIKYLIDTKKFFVYPRFSLSTNFGDPGVHFHKKLVFQQVPLLTSQRNFIFKALNESYVKYDSNCEALPEVINRFQPKYSKFEYTVDLYGVKTEYQISTEYILTSKHCHSFVYSYAREVKPIEYNIMLNIRGSVLALAKRKDCEMEIRQVYLQDEEIYYYHALRDYQLKYPRTVSKPPDYTTRQLYRLLMRKIFRKNY